MPPSVQRIQSVARVQHASAQLPMASSCSPTEVTIVKHSRWRTPSAPPIWRSHHRQAPVQLT